MPSTPQDISHYERQNAVISYCFLGIFILLSRQERFQSVFVRSHAKIASVIQFFMLILVIATIYSKNFGSMLIFDFSLSNIAYFLGFGTLFAGLCIGVIQALLGKMPRINFKTFSLQEISHHIAPTGIEGVEKIPMILSHIPIIGNMIAAKYGQVFYSGERFATWSFLLGIFFLWLDPSMTMMIIWWSLVSLWIIYQSISLAIDNSMTLLGNFLPNTTAVHIYLLTFITYTRYLISHTHGDLPHWGSIAEQIKTVYTVEKNEKVGEIVTFPLINLAYIIKNIHTTSIRTEIIQGSLITLFFVISIYFMTSWLLFLILFMSYCGFLSLRYQKYLTIPLVQELSSVITKCIRWLKEKSEKETATFTS